MSVIVFIHAKGNSDRVECKNKQKIGEYPLFVHSILSAKKCNNVNEVIIDSDDDWILKTGCEYGATPIKRPVELATNKTEGNALARWGVSQRPSSDIYVQLMCTSPFLKSSTIENAIKIIQNENINSVVTTYRQVLYMWKDGNPIHLLPDGNVPNSRLIEPYEYETTGLYASTTDSVKRTGCRMDPNSHKSLAVSLIEAIDINTEEELEFARLIYRSLNL